MIVLKWKWLCGHLSAPRSRKVNYFIRQIENYLGNKFHWLPSLFPQSEWSALKAATRTKAENKDEAQQRQNKSPPLFATFSPKWTFIAYNLKWCAMNFNVQWSRTYVCCMPIESITSAGAYIHFAFLYVAFVLFAASATHLPSSLRPLGRLVTSPWFIEFIFCYFASKTMSSLRAPSTMMRWSPRWCCVTFGMRKIFINYSAPTIMLSHYFLYALWMIRHPYFRSRIVSSSRRHQRQRRSPWSVLSHLSPRTVPFSRRINGDGTQIATLRLSAHGERSCQSLGLTRSVSMSLHHMAEWLRLYLFFSKSYSIQWRNKTATGRQRPSERDGQRERCPFRLRP